MLTWCYGRYWSVMATGLERLTGSHGRLILVDQSKTDNCRLNLLFGLSLNRTINWPAPRLSSHREKIKFVLILSHSHHRKKWKLETKINIVRIFSWASHGIIYISDNFPITILKNQIVIYFISGDKNSRGWKERGNFYNGRGLKNLPFCNKIMYFYLYLSLISMIFLLTWFWQFLLRLEMVEVIVKYSKFPSVFLWSLP